MRKNETSLNQSGLNLAIVITIYVFCSGKFIMFFLYTIYDKYILCKLCESFFLKTIREKYNKNGYLYTKVGDKVVLYCTNNENVDQVFAVWINVYNSR